jgi:thiazole/oxazole-forming peptide maturase SagD family component
VLTDDYLREDLGEINRRALAEGRPWLLVKPVGLELWIGPIFVPGATGCWACLAHRLKGHRKAEAYVQHQRGAAIHPNAWMLFSERRLADRAHWNQRGSRFSRVPEPFDPAREIEWSPVLPLDGGETRYLPTACLYYGYESRADAPFAVADSNGCASGATLEEAVFQGLMELVERDCAALWWYNRVLRPGADLASFGDPYPAELAAYYASIQRSLWALDLTHDLGIPVFVAVSRRIDKPAQDICFGFGAHLDPRIALERALTEMNQLLPAVMFASAEHPDRYAGDAETIHWWKTATVEREPYLSPDANAPPRRLADFSWLGSDDLREDILSCVRLLRDRGLRTYALDQSRPDTGLHVARVIVPGLRHFWARFAPGRLYDVPV